MIRKGVLGTTHREERDTQIEKMQLQSGARCMLRQMWGAVAALESVAFTSPRRKRHITGLCWANFVAAIWVRWSNRGLERAGNLGCRLRLFNESLQNSSMGQTYERRPRSSVSHVLVEQACLPHNDISHQRPVLWNLRHTAACHWSGR
jgi:hypothetical protein